MTARATSLFAAALVLDVVGCRPAARSETSVAPMPDARAAATLAPPQTDLETEAGATIATVPTGDLTAAPPEAPLAAGSTSPPAPYGPPKAIAKYSCSVVQRGGPFKSYLAPADTRLAFVDGDENLALVNRSPTGALAPDYAPGDLVDLHDGKPRTSAQCDAARECLRHDAYAGLKSMLDAMRNEKIPGHVVSSYRGFGTQCWVFASWANKARGGFCEATAQSALPGHSQHQLGTTVDLFTTEWADRGNQTGEGVFRNGFGCSNGGKWLDENAWRYGFVLPYPIHPDDRKDGSRCEVRRDHAVPIDPKTGYKNEPWHLRFVGVDAAAKYHAAWQTSGPGTPDEITLEQWLRAQRGLAGDAELPVCDGCQCGACETLAGDEPGTPCGKESLRLDESGRFVSPPEEPHIVEAKATIDGGAIQILVTARSPAHLPTQPPVTDHDGPVYEGAATYRTLAPYPDAAPRAFADLTGVWRIAVEPATATAGAARWPWRVSLADAKLATTWNRANVVLPAKSGVQTIAVHLHGVTLPEPRRLRVTLLRDGVEHDTRDVDVR